MKCLQEREEQIKILHEKITEIQKCTQEQLEEKSSHPAMSGRGSRPF